MNVAKNISSHDKFFKSFMTDLRIAKDFLQYHLPPEIISQINLNNLSLCKETFIEPELKISMADLLYAVNFNNKKGFIYILTEHQSTPDKLMSFRLLKYICKIMDAHSKENSGELPIIYPLVFYNGKTIYPYSTDIFDLFGENKLLAEKILFKPFKLIDLNQVPDDEIKQHKIAGLMEFFMKHIRARDILLRIIEAAESFRGITFEEYYLSVINYLIVTCEIENKDTFLDTINKAFAEPLGGKTMTVAEMLRAEGLQEGMLAGRQKGREEGREEGALQGERDLLIRQLFRKFNAIPDVHRQAIDMANSNTLLRWGEQILDAKTIEEVFA